MSPAGTSSLSHTEAEADELAILTGEYEFSTKHHIITRNFALAADPISCEILRFCTIRGRCTIDELKFDEAYPSHRLMCQKDGRRGPFVILTTTDEEGAAV